MILPSIRVIVRLAKNSPKNQSRIPEPTNVNKSKLVIPLRWSGVILALHPNTKKILKRLLPITLPMAISGFFFNAATMEVASSGREVAPLGAYRYQSQADNRFTDSQTAGNTSGSIDK